IRGIRALRSRHRTRSAAVVHVGELGLEIRLVRTTHTGTVGIEGRAAGLAELYIASLRHEAVDNAMKHDAIIRAFPRQLLDASHVARRQVGKQFDDHLPLGGFHDERLLAILDLGHSIFPFDLWSRPCGGHYLLSEAMRTLTIRSGSVTSPFPPSPFL